MLNNYKRNDRHQRTLLQRPPVDRVDPPKEDERRRKWTHRWHAGNPQHNMSDRGRRRTRARTFPH
jgi:hypothetical protein